MVDSWQKFMCHQDYDNHYRWWLRLGQRNLPENILTIEGGEVQIKNPEKFLPVFATRPEHREKCPKTSHAEASIRR
jgi:hypothetical protein